MIDAEELANRLECHVSTIYRYCHELGMPHIQMIKNGIIRFDYERVLEWLERKPAPTIKPASISERRKRPKRRGLDLLRAQGAVDV